MSTRAPATSVRAWFPAQAADVGRWLDGLADSFDSVHVAVAAAEGGDGRWTISLDFHDPPNQTAVRAIVAPHRDEREEARAAHAAERS